MLTSAQLLLIETAAEADVGRPELRCQMAMADIYKAAGLLPSGMVVPEGNRDWSRAEKCSLFTPFIESCGYFETVNTPAMIGQSALDLALPGDLIGYRLARVIHHVSILLTGGRIVHVFGQHGVQIAPCIAAEWIPRVEKIWRPVQQRGLRPIGLSTLCSRLSTSSPP